MNIFDKLLNKVESIRIGLTSINQSRSYRMTRFLRTCYSEIKSMSFKRICHICKQIVSRIFGKKDAMKEYIQQDIVVRLLEETEWMKQLIEQKTAQHQEIVQELVENRNDSLGKNLDAHNWLQINYTRFESLPTQRVGKRVAYFTNLLLDWDTKLPRFGGGERYCLTLSRLLKKEGFEIDIYQTAPTEFSGEYYGFPVQTIPFGNYYSEFNIDAAEKFYEISLGYDYVIYNLPELSAMKMRSDALTICHGIWFDHANYGGNIKFRENKWFEHLYRAFENPQHIVSVDTNSINVIRVLWPNLVNKMTFIPNFVDHQTFFPPKDSRANSKLKILFPRRSQINRGSRLMSGILQAIPYDVDIYWVGEGDSVDTELLKELEQSDKRLHYRTATFDEMPEWYRKADIAVIPTIACEGTSLSCIEAMASGCATISTNVGGLTDLVFDELNGLLVNPTVEEIAEAINRLISDDDLRQGLQERGLIYSHNFSIENWEKRWLKVLENQGWIKKNKYCIVTKNAIHGGVESLIALESQALGADVFVAGGLDNPEKTCPFKYCYIDNYMQLVESLSHYQCILYHWPYAWAVKAIRDSGVPAVEFVHRTDTAECDKQVPKVIVSHSQYVCNYITDTYDRDCKLVPNVVDTDFYIPASIEKEKIIGAVTSYYDTKGIDILIRAWRQVQNELPGYRFIIYGAGDQRVHYEALARELGCRIEICGPVSSSKKAYDKMLLVVSASRIEGLPIALLEAISCGIPILASDIDGHVIINKLAESKGFAPPIATFETENADALAEQLLSIVPNIDKLFPSAEELHDTAVAVFSPKQHIEGLMSAFSVAQNHSTNMVRRFADDLGCVSLPGQLYSVDSQKLIDLFPKQKITNNNYAVYNAPLKVGSDFLSISFVVEVNEITNITVQIDASYQDGQRKTVCAEGFLLEKQTSSVVVCYEHTCDLVENLYVSLRCNINEGFLLDDARITYFSNEG